MPATKKEKPALKSFILRRRIGGVRASAGEPSAGVAVMSLAYDLPPSSLEESSIAGWSGNIVGTISDLGLNLRSVLENLKIVL